ncbi:MAG: hypothetical protein U9Q03_00140 [Patescibacteria group bacterium]|nr:hypothetical protein [Patescibacteria group bacterium]
MTHASLSTIFKYRLVQVKESLRVAGWAKFFVAGVFLAVILTVMFGIYMFFNRSFVYLLSEPYAGPAIVMYVLELAFAAVFLLGVVSFVIASYTLMFQNEEAELLFTMPVPPQTVFAYRFAVAMFLSSWPIFVLAMPAIAALGMTIDASWAYYISTVGALTLFALLIAVTGGILSFLFALAFRKVAPSLAYLAEIALFFGIAIMASSRVMTREIFTVLAATTPQGGEAAVSRIREIFQFAPTHHLVEFLTALTPGVLEAGSVVGLIFASAFTLALLGVLAIFAWRLYIPLWQLYRERRFIARPKDVITATPRSSRPFPRVLKWGHGYLFEKDLLAFTRNPEEVSRASFLVALLALYILAVRGLSMLQAFEKVEMFAAAVAFIYVAVGYFTLTTCMRFAFPSFSLEGRAAWIVWASPVHAHEIFSWKYFFWASFLFVIMGAVTWISAALFALPAVMIMFLLYATACTVLAVTVLALGQGAMRPNFRDQNPDTLSTSPSGLLATTIGLAYLFVVARYVYMFSLMLFTEAKFDVLAGFGILVVTLALASIYWLLGHRAVDRLEIA